MCFGWLLGSSVQDVEGLELGSRWVVYEAAAIVWAGIREGRNRSAGDGEEGTVR